MSTKSAKTEQIAKLNDLLRQTGFGGTTVITQGIQALSDADRAIVFQAVQAFDGFNRANDPHREHDFAIVKCSNGITVNFKVDYYDLNMQYLSEDPADPTKTKRVLTIMLPSEY